ncbi:MAG: SpoIIE family protein phosphatase [Proteobacteria bacterium]|nr:SpoIIE family protein phosphatase [Pseudomonadota bacterium]
MGIRITHKHKQNTLGQGLIFPVIALVWGAMLALAQPCNSQTRGIELRPEIGMVNLSRSLSYMEDKNDSFHVDDLISGKSSGLWQENTAENMNFGYTDSVYWVMGDCINTRNESMKYLIEIAYPVIDYITVYAIRKDQRDTWTLGDKFPFDERPIKHRNFVIPVRFAPHEQVRFIFRVKTTSSMQIPIRAWTEAGFMEENQAEVLGLSLYYGAMMVMIVYNLFIFMSIKEINYLYYVIYVVCMTLFVTSLNGTSYQYLWPNATHWNDQVIVASLNGVVLFALLFVLGFLRGKEHYPKNYILLMMLAWIGGFQIIASFFTSYRLGIASAIILAIIAIVYGYFLLIGLCIKGLRSAKIFLVAWSVMLVGGVTLALNKFGLLPRNFITENAAQIGSVLEVTLLSFAMADRLNREKKARIEAQAVASNRERLARIANENALIKEQQARKAREEAIRIQKRASETLERKVAERTRQLDQSLNEVKTANDHIVSSLTYARMIQKAMLPHGDVINNAFLDHFIWWEPRDMVGGDFYMIEWIDTGYILGVGDCTGHGVPGSFMTLIVNFALNRIIRGEKCYDPGQILAKLNKHIKKTLKQDTQSPLADEGLDIGFCSVDLQQRILTFSGARLDLNYTHNGIIQTAKGDNQSLGYTYSNDHHHFKTHRISIEPGMNFYLATDGIYEQPGEGTGLGFGKKRLRELMLDNSDLPFDRQHQVLRQAFETHRGKRDQVDDLTMVAFRLGIY